MAAGDARVLQVIEVEMLRGKGTEADLARIVRVYRTLDGEFLAEFDPCTDRWQRDDRATRTD